MQKDCEDRVVERTRKDVGVAVNALRRAIKREDKKFANKGLGNKLSLILDELLAMS